MYRLMLVLTLLATFAIAQDAKPAPSAQQSSPEAGGKPAASGQPAATSPQKTVPIAVSRAQRLGAAKSAFVKKTEGSDIPVNVITNSLQGWGRYALVDSPAKADLIIEISAPEAQGSSVTINGGRTNPLTGYPDQTGSVTRNISNVPIKMTVFDAKTKLPLWSAVEQPKRALKQKGREDNLVEAAESLFSKFHQAVEPAVP